MIIDSHAHYAHPLYDGAFSCLVLQEEEYALDRTAREALFKKLKENGTVCLIEPSIGYDGIEKQLALVEKYPEFMRAAAGVHPTRCIKIKWSCRKNMAELAAQTDIVAIGETGLDYHLKRKQQRRLYQKAWFVYQIKLADRLDLPLILHVRDADEDALRILKMYKKKLRGGIAHCFTGNSRQAQAFFELGFKIGIGGYLLWDDERGRRIGQAVCSLPLSALVIETDAPYVLPDVGKLCTKKQKQKLRNSSLILPALIRRIAELKGVSYEQVEQAVYENTVQALRLKEEWTG